MPGEKRRLEKAYEKARQLDSLPSPDLSGGPIESQVSECALAEPQEKARYINQAIYYLGCRESFRYLTDEQIYPELEEDCDD